MKQPLENNTFVIFGATGNLARTKLMPALYHLNAENLLPEDLKVLGVGRRLADRKEWIAELEGDLKNRVRGGLDKKLFKNFCSKLEFFNGGLREQKNYQDLAEFLNQPQFNKNISF